MRNILIISGLWMASVFSLSSAYAIGDIKPLVRYHQNNKVVVSTSFEEKGTSIVTDSKECQWVLRTDKQPVPGDKTALDYTFTWELKKGMAENVSFAVDFEMDEWTPDNYVFVPAIVYDGNRFATKDIGYPPFWYDKAAVSYTHLTLPTICSV